ncbi:MAG: c-type cytochrome biogenesis protein CcmI, partial [Betaproteobacteria bacterium]
VAVLMVAAALAWVLWPLLRPANRKSIEQRAANLTIFKDQFADLDADLRRGSISQDQYGEARAELERRMLDEARAEKTAPAPAPVARFKTALVLAAAVPIVAGVLYAKLGAPDAFSPLATATQDQHQLTGAQVEEMTAKLAARLEKEPDNIDGWVMLARTYYSQRKFAEASRAYEKLTTLLPNEPALYADYADALAMAQGRKIAGKPLELVNKALALDPNQWKALAMAGTEAFDRKDFKAAVEYWERLKASSAGEPIAQQIQGSIDEARRLGGLPSSPDAGAAPVAAAKATPAPAAPAKPSAAAGAGTNVSGTVTLSAELKAKAGPNDAVYVFARPADGSKMPIAITRAQVKDLPLKFTLDDSTSMSADVKISGFQEVIVAARVSKSGSAMPASGDFEGITKPVKVGSSGLAVTIDRVLP